MARREAVDADRAMAAAMQRAAYLASAAACGRERAPSRSSTATYLAGETIAELDEDLRKAIARARHPQRAADLGRADRHDLALRRQCLLGHRAGVQLPLHAQRADARRHPPRGRGHRLRLSPVPPPQGRDRAAARLFRRCADRWRPAITWSCRRRCRNTSTARSRRRSTCRPIFPFEQFKDIYLQAYELGCKGCTTYRPNEVTGAVLEVKPGDSRGRAAAPSCRCRRRSRKPRTSTRPAASSI